jgi:hypothetical protein
LNRNIDNLDSIPNLTSWLGRPTSARPAPALRPPLLPYLTTIPSPGLDVGEVTQDGIEAIADLRLPCLLCGAPEAIRGYFTPDDHRGGRRP